MAEAKIRSLHVRPLQSADLAFETAGIIAAQSPLAKLGARVTQFDQLQVASQLSASAADPATLIYDDQKIRSTLANNYLFMLRNDTHAARLRESMVEREIAFLERFKHMDAIVTELNALYPSDPKTAGSKLRRIEDLRLALGALRNELVTAYRADKLDVVRATTSVASSEGPVQATTRLAPVTIRNTPHAISVNNPASQHSVGESKAIPQYWNAGAKAWEDCGSTFESQTTLTNSDAFKQTTRTSTVEYRHPLYETMIADERAQLDLQDELLTHRIFARRIPDMKRIMTAQLRAVDAQVAQAQIRFMQSFLVSPIAGVVTAVYKDIGESVQPGEPVIRIENDERILLVGLLQYRNVLQLGQKLRISSSALYETQGSAITLPGEIVAVRGHDSDDDEWDVVIECANRDAAKLPLPINYHFDRNTSKVEIA